MSNPPAPAAPAPSAPSPSATSPPRRAPARALAAAAAALVAFAAYALTSNFGLGYVDHGEMAAVAATLGIAHPTGYPTLTLLGFAATRLLPFAPIVSLAWLAAALVAASVAALTLLFDEAIARVARAEAAAGAPARPAAQRGGARAAAAQRSAAGRTPSRTIAPGPRAWLAALAALATGLNGLWWEQALGFEAYALHALLLPLVVLAFLRWVDAPARPEPRAAGPVFGVLLGLAFTSHAGTVLLAPAMLVLAAWRFGVRADALRRVARLVPWVALGLLPYLYLPLRSAAQPRFDWGDPVIGWRFWDHVTGRQFRVWMFSESGTFEQQTGWFFARLPEATGWLGGILALVGLALLLRRDARLGVFALLAVAGSVVYAGGYGILEIAPYYLPAVLALGLAIAAALAVIAVRQGARAALATAGGVVVLALAVNGPAVSRRGDDIVERFTRDVLEPLPERAVVMSAQWDTWVSPSYYLQAVARVRPDVTVIDQELLRRTWYLDELERRDPELVRGARAAIDHFRREVEPFERARRFDPRTIESAYTGMIDGLLGAAAAQRPTYVTRDLPMARVPGFRRVPQGLLLRLHAGDDYLPQFAAPFTAPHAPRSRRPELYEGMVRVLRARAHMSRAIYEARHRRDSLAAGELARAQGWNPRWNAAESPPLPWIGPNLLREQLDYFADLPSATLRDVAQGALFEMRAESLGAAGMSVPVSPSESAPATSSPSR